MRTYPRVFLPAVLLLTWSPFLDNIIFLRFNKFIWNLATRYNNVINYFEIWNEPQNAQFLYPYNSTELSTLATMTSRAYSTIKSINAGAYVLSGSLLPRASSGGMTRAQQYLDAIQSNGWNVDAFSVHVRRLYNWFLAYSMTHEEVSPRLNHFFVSMHHLIHAICVTSTLFERCTQTTAKVQMLGMPWFRMHKPLSQLCSLLRPKCGSQRWEMATWNTLTRQFSQCGTDKRTLLTTSKITFTLLLLPLDNIQLARRRDSWGPSSILRRWHVLLCSCGRGRSSVLVRLGRRCHFRRPAAQRRLCSLGCDSNARINYWQVFEKRFLGTIHQATSDRSHSSLPQPLGTRLLISSSSVNCIALCFRRQE